MKEREAKALLACETDYTNYEIAEAFMDAAKESMLSSRDRKSGFQTLVTSIRDQT